MRLEVGGLPGDPSVADAVRFIEAVTGKVDHEVEDVIRRLFIDAILHGACDKGIPVLLQDLRLLVSHGAAEHVGLAEGKTAHDRGDLHDLFLIEDDAVGFLQDGSQRWMRVLDGDLSMFSLDEIFRHAAAQRSRTVECDHRDEVFEAVRVELHQKIRKAGGLGLENACGVARAEHLARLLVDRRNAVDVDGDTAVRPDHLDRIMDDGEVSKPQEIHLEKAELLDLIFFVLRLDEIVRSELDRHVLIDGLRADDDAGGMRAGISGKPFKIETVVDQCVHRRIRLVEVFEFLRAVQRLLQRDARAARHHLCDLVHFAKGQIHDTADITDDGTRRKRTEGDDLRHLLGAVLLCEIGDDLPASAIAEVGIDIRHGDSLRIQEAFKEKVETQWIDFRDVQEVGDDASCRAPTPRPDRDAMCLRVADEVHDDQEVIRESHLIDDTEFIIQTLLLFSRGLRIALRDRRLAELSQV